MNPTQPFLTIHTDKRSKREGRQHISIAPPNQNVKYLLQDFHPPFRRVDISFQGAQPSSAYSQIPSICDPMCSEDGHSPHRPHAVDDGGEGGACEYRSGFIADESGRTAEASSIGGKR